MSYTFWVLIIAFIYKSAFNKLREKAFLKIIRSNKSIFNLFKSNVTQNSDLRADISLCLSEKPSGVQNYKTLVFLVQPYIAVETLSIFRRQELYISSGNILFSFLLINLKVFLLARVASLYYQDCPSGPSNLRSQAESVKKGSSS